MWSKKEAYLMLSKIFKFYIWHSIFKHVIHYSLLEFDINLENLYMRRHLFCIMFFYVSITNILLTELSNGEKLMLKVPLFEIKDF